MMEYNALFFGLYELFFKVMKKEVGEQKALDIFRKVMEEGLTGAFGTDFKKGSIDDFARIVGAVDAAVGLKVEVAKINDKEFYFRLHNDIFPNLKGLVTHDKVDAIYMPFKVNYMLGKDWDYKCTKHLWNGGSYTEFHVFKK